MTVDERLARIEANLENLSKEVHELNKKIESRVLENGKQDISITALKVKQKDMEEKIEKQDKKVNGIAAELRTDIKHLTRKVYLLMGVLTGIQSVITFLIKVFSK